MQSACSIGYIAVQLAYVMKRPLLTDAKGNTCEADFVGLQEEDGRPFRMAPQLCFASFSLAPHGVLMVSPLRRNIEQPLRGLCTQLKISSPSFPPSSQYLTKLARQVPPGGVCSSRPNKGALSRLLVPSSQQAGRGIPLPAGRVYFPVVLRPTRLMSMLFSHYRA